MGRSVTSSAVGWGVRISRGTVARALEHAQQQPGFEPDLVDLVCQIVALHLSDSRQRVCEEIS
jgi:hypothetical protein